jgi:hypothetical protein
MSAGLRKYKNVLTIAIVFGIWKSVVAGGGFLDDHFQVASPSTVHMNNIKTNAHDVYSALSEDVITPENIQPTVKESIFKKQVQIMAVNNDIPVVVAPVIDYDQILKDKIELNGLSDNGAFVNGIFYCIGDKLEKLAYLKGSGEQVVPILKSVHANSVSFLNGQSVIKIDLFD